VAQPGYIPKVSFATSPDLGELTKLVSIVTALAYIIGVVAVNTYLHDLGIVDFSFAKPKLVLTGVLVLFTFLLLAAPPFFLAWFLATHPGQKGRAECPRGILVSIGIFLVILVAASACLCFGAGRPGLGQITVWRIWEIMKPNGDGEKTLTAVLLASAVYLPIVVGSVSVYTATRIVGKTKLGKPVGISAGGVYLLVAIAFVVLSTIGYVYIFTSTFYPAIPQEYGGGEPYYESFSIADGDICQLQQLGIPFEQDKRNITTLLPVVHETDTEVAVWLKVPKEKGEWQFAIGEVNKKLISSMMARQAESKPVALLTSVACKE
jgi:hypothetical protein